MDHVCASKLFYSISALAPHANRSHQLACYCVLCHILARIDFTMHMHERP